MGIPSSAINAVVCASTYSNIFFSSTCLYISSIIRYWKLWGADKSRFSFIEYLSRNEIENLMLQHTNNYYLGGGVYFWYDKKDGEYYSITINDNDFNDFDSGFGDPIIIKKI